MAYLFSPARTPTVLHDPVGCVRKESFLCKVGENQYHRKFILTHYRCNYKLILQLKNSKSILKLLADPVGGHQEQAPPPTPLGPSFFIFMQYLGKIGQNNRLTPPSLGNPGSATTNERCQWILTASISNNENAMVEGFRVAKYFPRVRHTTQVKLKSNEDILGNVRNV